jgi:hypothetical protein
MAIVWGTAGGILYDVADPMHPHAVCRISNTYARILTGTAFEYLVPQTNGTTKVVIHALGSNNESVEATLQADMSAVNVGVWFAPITTSPGHGVMAYSIPGGTDSNGFGITDVWVADTTSRTKIFSYAVGGVDSFGRPGLPWPTLALSPDGEYLAAGWAITGVTVHVFRLSDRADISPAMPPGLRFGFWSRTGHSLYLVGSSVEAWTPEGGASPVPGSGAWTLAPNFSPDGTLVAFTAITASHDIRSYTYDFKTRAAHLLIDQPRSSALFVKAGWLWYLEEKPCVPSSDSVCFDPTLPDGNVLAINVGTGVETPVAFAAGESPLQANSAYWSPGDVWPLG